MDRRAANPPTPGPIGARTMSGALPQALRYHRYLYSRVSPFLGRRVWEIGAGHGQYTSMLLDDARAVLATDIDGDLVSRLAGPRALSIARVDLTDESTIAACAAWRPDSVLCLNVLEHIDQDRRALAWMREHIGHTCRAVFLTPAFSALFGFMDREAGHVRRYTRTSLRSVFDDAGWTVESDFYLNAIGGAGWFVRNRVLPPREQILDSANDDIRFFDRWLVPVTSALDPVFRAWFGQSVVVVASI